MRGWGVAVVVALVAAAPAAALLPPLPGTHVAPWGAWSVSNADASADSVAGLTGGPRLELDDRGRPHILYGAGPDDDSAFTPFYAYFDGVSWTKIRVQDGGGREGGLAFDPSAVLHIVYFASAANGWTLKHGVWTGAGFALEDVATNLSVGESDVEFDSSGKMHVTFTGGSLFRYAHKVDGIWKLETIDDQVSGDFTGRSSAVAADGSVHVAYADTATGETIRYARRSTSGAWSVETVAGCMWYVALAVDAQARPHIACQSPSQGHVYLHHDGTQWVKEVLDDGAWWKPSNYRGYGSDIAVDSQGRPHISYNDRYRTSNTNDPLFAAHLKYAAKTPAGWIYETVDAAGTATGYASDVEIDAHDRPRIAYVHWWLTRSMPYETPGRFDLRYAEPASVVLGAVGE